MSCPSLRATIIKSQFITAKPNAPHRPPSAAAAGEAQMKALLNRQGLKGKLFVIVEDAGGHQWIIKELQSVQTAAPRGNAGGGEAGRLCKIVFTKPAATLHCCGGQSGTAHGWLALVAREACACGCYMMTCFVVKVHTHIKHDLSGGGFTGSQVGWVVFSTSSTAAWNVICRKLGLEKNRIRSFMAPFLFPWWSSDFTAAKASVFNWPSMSDRVVHIHIWLVSSVSCWDVWLHRKETRAEKDELEAE